MAEKTISTLGVTDWREERLPDLKGKIYVITGGNSGIGFEAARMLGEAGADVILACRSPEKAQSARLQLLTTTKGSVSLVGLDLADTASVRAGAEGVRGMTDRIDGLINNAGIMHTPALKTKDGFELQFGTNHLGHFLWTALLLDLVEAAAGRVVAVSSLVHKTGKKTIDFDDLMLEKRYSRFDAYAQSKLANLMFAFELDRRLAAKGSPAIAVACHPGYSVTNLQTTGPSRLLAMLYSVIKHGLSQSAHFGARPTVLAAAGVEAKRGAYYGPTRRKELLGPVSDARVSSRALDQSVQKRLWQESEKLLGISFPA